MSEPSKLTLRRSLKRYYKGMHRVLSPEETEKTLLRKVRNSGLPIYFKLLRIDGLDKIGVPIYAVQYSDVFNNTKKPNTTT